MRLYYSPGACSVAVHILLEELGAPYDTAAVLIGAGENLDKPFLEINPRGRLPLLEDGSHSLRETGALLTYLALKYPEKGFLPPLGSYEFGRCLEWLGWVGTTHHNNLMVYWRPQRICPGDGDLKAVADLAKERFVSGSEEIEEALAGPWFLGERYTIVDPYLLFCYRQGNRIGLPMAAKFPSFTKWAERMLERPAVRTVWDREGINIDGDAARIPYKSPAQDRHVQLP